MMFNEEIQHIFYKAWIDTKYFWQSEKNPTESGLLFKSKQLFPSLSDKNSVVTEQFLW